MAFRQLGWVLCVMVGAAVGCGEDEPQPSQCEQFLSYTKGCYESAGIPVQVNTAACSDPAAITPEIRAQIDCAMLHKDAWCRLIQSANLDAGTTIDPKDPEVLALNACVAEQVTKSPCKEALHVLAECGTTIGFLPECVESAPAIAQCILDHPESACAGLGGSIPDGGDGGMAYQQCVQEAYLADAGTE